MRQPVTILVATFNNARFLEELLDSLVRQTYRELDIIVRDDGSSDTTRDIINRYCDIDRRIKTIDVKRETQGSKNNFFTLLLSTDGEYTMFCDADDVWHTDKVEKTLALMKNTEKSLGNDIPILVHTDLAVTDESLNIISNSLFKYEKLSPKRCSFKNLLVQNNVTGCSVMINRPLKQMVRQIPKDAVMHDWWLALTAAAFGRIEVLYEPTLMYRQHQHNQIGASDARDSKSMLRKLRRTDVMRTIYRSMYAQAACFAETFNDRLSNDIYACAKKYAEMSDLSKARKIFRIIGRGYYKNTFIRNIGQLLVV